jgi:tRNA(His) guanylyltransferase
LTHDALGTRMKENYEFRARSALPRRTYTIIRLDGKAFHSYTRGLERPFDLEFMDDMAETAIYLCQEVQGCKLAYTQSDEISLVLTDFEGTTTQAWFDGDQQKIVSISASSATARFNQLRPGKLARFDSRAFTIPDPTEVENYFIWRQKDATRNSVSMAAQAHFSHAELQGKSVNEMQEMLFTKHDINWNDYDPRFKRGSTIAPATTFESVTYTDKRTGKVHTTEATERRTWGVIVPPPDFLKQREWLTARIAGEKLELVTP